MKNRLADLLALVAAAVVITSPMPMEEHTRHSARVPQGLVVVAPPVAEVSPAPSPSPEAENRVALVAP